MGWGEDPWKGMAVLRGCRNGQGPRGPPGGDEGAQTRSLQWVPWECARVRGVGEGREGQPSCCGQQDSRLGQQGQQGWWGQHISGISGLVRGWGSQG